MNCHKLRLEKLKEMWKEIVYDLHVGLGDLEPILEERVFDNILDLLIKKHTLLLVTVYVLEF